MMDDLADRAPQFAVFFISPIKDNAIKIVTIDSYRLLNCDGILNQTGCLDLVCKIKTNEVFFKQIFYSIYRK